MKFRTDFVTNSSSSGFLVAFKTIPKTVEELQKMLFGDEKSISDYDDDISTSDAAQRIFDDMRDKDGKIRPATPKTIANALEHGWLSEDGFESPEMEGFYPPDGEFDFDAWQVAMEKVAKRFHSHFVSTIMEEKLTIFYFCYGDEDGRFDGILEHSDVFEALKPHVIRISYH